MLNLFPKLPRLPKGPQIVTEGYQPPPGPKPPLPKVGSAVKAPPARTETGVKER